MPDRDDLFKMIVATVLIWVPTVVPADDPETAAPKHSKEVIAKAEAILQEAGLRRSGKGISALGATDCSRAISALARQRRELKMTQQDLRGAEEQLSNLEQQLQHLNAQDGQLNLELAAVAGKNVSANNRMVGLINATRSAVVQVRTQMTAAREMIQQKRAVANQSEAAYAEAVFSIRKEVDRLRTELDEKLMLRDVGIAMKVMATNFDVPVGMTGSQILRPIESRLAKVEAEIFSESIPLQIEPNGSMFVNVSVNSRTRRMVVDSGATLICLPAREAKLLEIEIPPDAPVIKLIVANGEEVGGRSVILKSVRVGQFEVKDAMAAVMDEQPVAVEPLLGMTFLSHFKFEIDAAEKTLRLLRVSTE